jgi:pyruvate/2-oxoglutarate dehydrogenase complex dihydrolipoamide dehydrogenase (E3) component
MSVKKFDVLFLGSGQSANVLAKDFARAGRSTAVVERSALGGTCVNVGCTPTKTIIASGRVAYLAHRAPEYGVHADNISVDMRKVRDRKRKIVEQWNSGSVNGLQKAGVEIFMGEAKFVEGKQVNVKLQNGESVDLTAETIFISAGARSARPKIEGLEQVEKTHVVDSTSIMELYSVPKHLVVIGGGYIGLEFGQLFRRLGANVTVIQRAKQLVPKEDPDVAECLLKILEQDGIKVHLSADVKSITKTDHADMAFTINFHTADGDVPVTGSHLLLAAGRTPNTDLLDVSKAGVKTTPRGDVVVDDKLRTNVDGIYALGDIHGGPAFTHISYDDARIIRTNLLADTLSKTTPKMPTTQSSKSRVLTPYVMYTDPQLGHIGLHDRDLVDRKNVKTASMPMEYVARALETAEPRGMMKAAVDAETGEILGFTCLGLEGGEVMSIVQTAMMGGLKYWDLEAAVYAHPTLAESLNTLWGYLK